MGGKDPFKGQFSRVIVLMKKFFVLIMLTFSVAAVSCSSYTSRRIEKGNEIVNKIENFRRENGKIPESLTELGIEVKEEGPIYYRKESGSRYVVWLGRELGESVTYDSDIHEWKP